MEVMKTGQEWKGERERESKKDLRVLCTRNRGLEGGRASRIHPPWGSVDAERITPG